MNTDTLVARYDSAVPRYTSYPTAPHFSPQIDAAAYARWLGALAPTAAASLYLHVPFCRQLCLYCGCHTQAVRRQEPVDHYVALLLREIDLVTGSIGRRQPVSHVHLGGGTPSILGPRGLRTLFAALRARFSIAADAEIAIELDPRHVDEADAAALAEIGVTRASLGVQDFDPVVQAAIGRVQSFELTAQIADLLRRHGISAINLDLIYGLPHQTVAGVRQTAQLAASLDPDRLAVFGYAHVPWMKRHQALLPEAALPEAAPRFEQRAAIEQALIDAGYLPVGMDHYAKPQDGLARHAAAGTLRRNFQGYTDDPAEALIGFGVSAIGSLPEGYIQNTHDQPTYQAALAEARLPVARGLRLTGEDRVRRRIIESLMCDFAVDLAEFGADWSGRFGAALSRIDGLAADGLVERLGGSIRLTPAGRPFVRTVAAAFDLYLDQSGARHSRPV
jgi:oxygen-independent coproporphyrinogen-3 oxidase